MMNDFPKSKEPEQLMVAGVMEQMEDLSESLVEIVWRHRGTMLLMTGLSLALGFLYLHYATRLYTSTSKIYVEQTGPQVFERDNSGTIARWDNYLYTQAERLRSTEILSAALQLPEVARLPTFADVNTPIAVLRQNLTVDVGKKDEIISVSFVSPYPEDAALIVNEVVNTYIADHEKRNRNTVTGVVKILREERIKRGEELLTKLQKIVKFKQENEGLAFGTDRDSNIIMKRLERLSEALTEAQLAAIESKSFHDAAAKLVNEPAGLRQLVQAQQAGGVYIVAEDEAASLRAELKRVENARADTLLELKADHPAIAALNAEIERLTKQLAEKDREYARGQLAVAEQRYLTARAKEEELQKSFEEQRQQAIVLNNQLSQFSLLDSDYEQTKKLCDLLDDSIQRLDVTTEVGTLNIGILERAEPTFLPSKPQKMKTMGMALFVGLFSGAGLTLIRQWKDRRLRSTQEISSLLGLPILGAVPSMGSPNQTPAVCGQKVRISPDSQEAEAFRVVRTRLFFQAPKEEVRTILVTSPAPREGKSTVTANLGIAIAHTGQRVLIIDADLRGPMQHRIFSLDRSTKGLSCVLTGEMAAEDAIEHTGMENLSILTCGPDVPNPAELLHHDTFARMVGGLVDQYDRILIDSPPVLVVTDPLILAALSDATILVLRAEYSTRPTSMQARESLTTVGAKVLGVVLNDVPPRSDRYGYHGEYSHYYGGHGRNGHRRASQEHTREVALEAMPTQSTIVNGGEEAGHDARRR
jgi:succinoglycan biosynthesis transport protein ExoP